MLSGLFRYSAGKSQRFRKIGLLDQLAEKLLQKDDLREKLCSALNDQITLPIDVANAVVPVLYEINAEDIPRDTMLFALLSKKIADRGIKVYCRQNQ